MTTALEGGEGSESLPGRSLPPGKTRYPFYRRVGGPQDRSGQVRKISPPTGIRSPDRPARSQSLYRLSYPAHSQCMYTSLIRTNYWIGVVAPTSVCLNTMHPLHILCSIHSSKIMRMIMADKLWADLSTSCPFLSVIFSTFFWIFGYSRTFVAVRKLPTFYAFDTNMTAVEVTNFPNAYHYKNSRTR